MTEIFLLSDPVLESILEKLDINSLIQLSNTKLDDDYLKQRQVEMISKEFVKRQAFKQMIYLSENILKRVLERLSLVQLREALKIRPDDVSLRRRYIDTVLEEFKRRPLADMSDDLLDNLWLYYNVPIFKQELERRQEIKKSMSRTPESLGPASQTKKSIGMVQPLFRQPTEGVIKQEKPGPRYSYVAEAPFQNISPELLSASGPREGIVDRPVGTTTTTSRYNPVTGKTKVYDQYGNFISEY